MTVAAIPRGQRIALVVEYDGCGFHGWQLQAAGAVETVQGALERALTRVADRPVRLFCSGRTDSGVHATHQVVHFDAPASRSARSWLQGTNRHLPDTVVVRSVHAVPAGFHARFSALSRRYHYLMLNAATSSAIAARRVTWVRRPLDVQAMHRAAQSLLGERDFSSFRAAACQSASALRRVDFIHVRRCGELVIIDVQANAFLYRMVRNLAAALIEVGKGQLSAAGLAALLAARDRSQAPPTAPAQGLYLVGVAYPPDFGVPEYSPGPFPLSAQDWAAPAPE